MNILINFRYISLLNITEEMISDINDSTEMDFLTNEFKNIALDFKDRKIKGKNFISENGWMHHEDAMERIEKTTLKWINYFNKSYDHFSYLWLDEICSVCIDGKKAIPLEDADDYVNFNDLKHTVQKCMYEIASKNPLVKPDNYCDVFFVVYLDIIEKDFPSFLVKSDWYG